MPKKVTKQISRVYFEALDAEAQQMFNHLYDEYNLQTVYKLREIARDMGVKSATTMHKAPLMERMVQKRLDSIRLRSGADAKKSKDALITDNDELIEDYLQKTLVLDGRDVDGFVCLSDGGARVRRRFAAADDDLHLPIRIVNDYALISGDYITGKARVTTGGTTGLYMIETVNGNKVQKGGRTYTAEVVCRPLDINVRLEGSPGLAALSCLSPFYYGGKRVISGCADLTAVASQIIAGFNKLGAKTAALFLDQMDGSEQLYALGGRVQVLSPAEWEKAAEAVMLACQHAKNTAGAGHTTVLLINNADILDESVLRRVLCLPRFIGEGSIAVILLSAGSGFDPKLNRISRLTDSVAEINDDGVLIKK